MGKIISTFLIYFLILFSISSCSLIGINKLFERGIINTNGQYVPKNDKYKFKNKTGFVFPENLDTVNIYRRINNEPNNPDFNILYLKFFTKGRCLSTSIPGKNTYKQPNQLQNNDLNPENSYCTKQYYFSKGGNKIEIETFLYGLGYGRYVYFDFFLNPAGDTLTMIYKNEADIYIKEVIPADWEKFEVNW